jgi:broad specificity phosphatase PhoE
VCDSSGRSGVVFIRHAPTDANLHKTFMGQTDWPLSRDGFAAAEKARDRFAGYEIGSVLCSPLSRARETARVLFPDLEPTIDERLAERSLGLWENRDKTSVREAWPDAFRDHVLDARFLPPGGEPWSSFVTRVQSVMCDLSARAAARPIAVVTHNGVIRVARHLVEGRTVEDVFAGQEPHLTAIFLQPSVDGCLRVAR